MGRIAGHAYFVCGIGGARKLRMARDPPVCMYLGARRFFIVITSFSPEKKDKKNENSNDTEKE